MDFINNQQVKEDEKSVKESLQLMGTLASEIVASGLNISVSEVYLVSTGQLSVTKIYSNEAKARTKNDPVYVQDEALRLASVQANKSQQTVNSLRKFSSIISRLPEKNFSMNEDCEFSYTSDLTKDLTALHTKKLSKKQIELVQSIENFKKSLEDFNTKLVEINLPKIEVKLPYVDHIGSPDLQAILTIDYESISEKIKRNVAFTEKQKQEKSKRLIEILNLIPANVPDRQSEAERYFIIEQRKQEKFGDSWIKNQYKKYDESELNDMPDRRYNVR